jgi:catecholate siderophore receptor
VEPNPSSSRCAHVRYPGRVRTDERRLVGIRSVLPVFRVSGRWSHLFRRALRIPRGIQSRLDDVPREDGPRRRADFARQAFAIRVHGAHANPECAGDLFATEAGGDGHRDLPFAAAEERGELRNRALRTKRTRGAGTPKQRADGSTELLHTRVVWDAGERGSGLTRQGGVGTLGAFVGVSKDQHADPRCLGSDPCERYASRFVPRQRIDEDHRRVELPGQRDGFVQVACIRHNGKSTRAAEQGPERRADQRMLDHEQDRRVDLRVTTWLRCDDRRGVHGADGILKAEKEREDTAANPTKVLGFPFATRIFSEPTRETVADGRLDGRLDAMDICARTAEAGVGKSAEVTERGRACMLRAQDNAFFLSRYAMRSLFFGGLGGALLGAPLQAQPVSPSGTFHTRPSAVSPSVGVASDTTRPRKFAIGAQSLAEALGVFARQADLVVHADPAVLDGVQSAAVSGVFAPGEALRRLLAGTGCVGRFTDVRIVVITRPGRDVNTAQPLQPVLVAGTPTRLPGYRVERISAATKTDTPLGDIPQSVTVVTRELVADQAMQSMADVVRYIPGITMSLGEGHRDQPVMRGNSTTADFFVDGLRDDGQYLRDLYNVDRIEALKGANAMAFGRGGGGGVLNRVLKAAEWTPTRTMTVEGGSFDHARSTFDAGGAVGAGLAGRVTAVAERSGGFRDAARLERFGVNPTLAVAVGPRTMLRLGYEVFRDARGVDRGIPSVQGRPVPNATRTFFGNPGVNEARATIHAVGGSVEHRTENGLTLRNRTRVADYNKFYQNTYPTAVSPDGLRASLSAYNHAIERRNVFNQTELTYDVATGPIKHTLLAGFEWGRQRTGQFRSTGTFVDGTPSGATTLSVPLSAPMVSTPVTFRQSATDADSWATASTGSAYLQDQIALTTRWLAVVGGRTERFSIRYHNNRNDQTLTRTDRFLAPRAGMVFKPASHVSVYSSYGVSALPSTGDQFTALSITSQMLRPERFRNVELGVKWDVRPDVTVSAAAYQSARTNTAAPDPTDAALTVQTGKQQTAGYELGVTGRVTGAWQVVGGFSAQRAEITSRTSVAPAGASVPLVPSRMVSLWNRYQVAPWFDFGVGLVHQSAMYAGIDNRVQLPRYTRVDGAVYSPRFARIRAQVNVENLFNLRYTASAFNNNNLMPGAPRNVRVSLTLGQ